MNNRDDFDQKVKETLAKRVAYRCSNPHCNKLTIAPGEDKNKTTNIGVAAHICAASPGGPRYDKDMSSQERKDINNGIWLCSNCAKLIDSDPNRYTRETLYTWKRQAENSTSDSFLRHKIPNITIPVEELNNLICSIDFILKVYQNINTNLFYENYRMAYYPEIDVSIYNMFVSVYNKFIIINNIKSKYYLQLQKLNIISILDNFISNIPSFYEETEYGSGVNMIETISSYLNYFKKLDDTIIQKLTIVLDILKSIQY